MKVKTVEIDGVTYAEVQDGKPVYLGDDGKEVAFDAPHMAATISRLNGEAKGHREAKEAAEKALKAYEGIEDPEQAREAMKVFANLKDKDLVDANEVERIKQAAIKSVEDKYAPYKEQAEKLQQELHQEKIGGSFMRSKFIEEKLAIPADFAEARFGKNFKLEDGKIVATDNNGNQIFSSTRPGDYADFDEALEILVDSYPYKDKILRGSQANGGGVNATSTNIPDKPKEQFTEAERTALFKSNPQKFKQIFSN